MWDAASVALLTKLWAKGHSAGQIATRLECSRNAVCAKLLRMGLKRGHKPPTAKPKIVSAPKRKPALLAACARPLDKVVSTRKPARTTCAYRKSSPSILVMQSTQDRTAQNASRCLGGT
jgi:GcrA cell cycle regulator